MGRCRVVVPDTVRIPISDGDWIEVIKHLNYGETKAMQAFAFGFKDNHVQADLEVVEIAQALGYLVGWSLVDLDGRPIRLETMAAKRVALFDQDPTTIKEIIAAVSAHAERMEQELEQEKNERAGVSASPAISTSVV